MNVYHITYAPSPGIFFLHFWGCNMECRACLCKKEIYDCHLEETKRAIFEESKEVPQAPSRFLDLNEVLEILKGRDISQVIFMGAEPTIDAELPKLAKALHRKFHSYNILLTNGLKLISTKHIDEVVLSIKAYKESLHQDYTGVSNKSILENFSTLYQEGKKLRAESLFIPNYIDSPEIGRIAQFIAGIDRNIAYRIDAYLPVGNNPWRRPTPIEVEQAAQVARRHLLNVSCLRGDERLEYEVRRIV